MIPIRYNLRSLMVRRATAAMTASVVALVVMLLFILSGFVAGLRATVMQNALARQLDRAQPRHHRRRRQLHHARAIRDHQEPPANRDDRRRHCADIARNDHRFQSESRRSVTSGVMFTLLRGVYPIGYQVHRGMRLESGRWPNGGAAEMVVGPQTGRALSEPRGRQRFQIRTAHFQNRRGFFRSGQRARIGNADRSRRADPGSPRRQRLRRAARRAQARHARRLRQIAHDRLARQSRYDVGAGVLREADPVRRSIARARTDRRTDSRSRIGIRRDEHDVLGGRAPHQRNRRAASAGLQPLQRAHELRNREHRARARRAACLASSSACWSRTRPVLAAS